MSLVKTLKLILDKGASAQLVADFRAAGAQSAAALQMELKKKMGDLRHDLAAGLIDKEEFRRKGAEAAKAYNEAVIERIKTLQAQGKLTTEEYNKLTKSLQLAGKTGGESASLLSRAWGGFKSLVMELGPAISVAFAVTKVIEFAKESIKLAIDSQKAYASLGVAIESIGIKWSDVKAEAVEATEKIQRTTRFDNDAAARAFQILVDKTQDYGKSLKNLGFVADYAAAKQMTMEEAAEILGKAMGGSVKALEKANPLYRGHANIVAELREHYKGFAEQELSTFAGGLAHLNNLWEDLKKTMGFVFVDSVQGVGVFAKLSAVVEDLTSWVSLNRTQVMRWLTAFIDGSVEVVKATGAAILWLDRFGQTLDKVGQWFNRLAFGIGIWFKTPVRDFLAMIASMEDALGRFVSHIPLLGGLGKAIQADAALAQGAADALTRSIDSQEKAIADSYKYTATIGKASAKELRDARAGHAEGTVKSETDAAGKVGHAWIDAGEASEGAAKKAETAHEKAAKKTAAMWKAALDQSIAGFKRIGDAVEIEVKTELTDLDRMIKEHDRKQFQAVKDSVAKVTKVRADGEAATRAAIVESGTVHTEVTDKMTSESTTGARSSADAWVNSLNLMVNSLQGLGKVAGGIFNGLTDALSGIASGIGSVLGGLDTISKGKAAGGLTGTLGQIAGGIGVVGGVAGAVGTVVDIIGGLFHRDKDPGRLRTNQEEFTKAVQNTDQAALYHLYQLSGRFQLGVGWATDAARDDAYEAYVKALQLNPGLTPVGTNTVNLRHEGGLLDGASGPVRAVDPAVFARARRVHTGGLLAGEVPFIGQTGEGVLNRGAMAVLGTAWLNAMNGPRTAPAALQALKSRGDDNRVLNVHVELNGVADRDVPRRVVEAIKQSIGQDYQKHAALQGNTALPE